VPLPHSSARVLDDTPPDSRLWQLGRIGLMAVPSIATQILFLANLSAGSAANSWVFLSCAITSSHSDILLQTCDPTWHAYNDFGAAVSIRTDHTRRLQFSLPPPGRFNVPTPLHMLSAPSIPVAMLEANGYDVSYIAAQITGLVTAL